MEAANEKWKTEKQEMERGRERIILLNRKGTEEEGNGGRGRDREKKGCLLMSKRGEKGTVIKTGA